jgi:hypothetical protein
MGDCTNNKDIFLTLLHLHVRAAHFQYLHNLEVDMADASDHDKSWTFNHHRTGG